MIESHAVGDLGDIVSDIVRYAFRVLGDRENWARCDSNGRERGGYADIYTWRPTETEVEREGRGCHVAKGVPNEGAPR
jgi:hypothetical protein